MITTAENKFLQALRPVLYYVAAYVILALKMSFIMHSCLVTT